MHLPHVLRVANEELLVFFLARFSFRHGFAACCEEWLRPSVELAFRLGCALVLEKSTGILSPLYGYHLEVKAITNVQSKGAAQAKESA